MSRRGEKTFAWQPGQVVVLDRRNKVTIERVTPTGRAIIDWHGDERTFNADGSERTSRARAGIIRPVTPELEAEIERARRTVAAFNALAGAISDADRWRRDWRPRWGHDLAEDGAMERAEALTAAICGALPTEPSA